MSSSKDGGAPRESSGIMNGCIRHGDGGVSSEEPSGPRPWGQQVVAKLTRAGKQCFRAIVSTVLRRGPIPKHVAFIMDGNRRWAEKRSLDRRSGHSFGFTQLKECLKWCLDLGITVVTVYAFSIENFKRSQQEVDSLMELAAVKLDELSAKRGFLERNQIRVQILGDISLLPERVQRAAARAMLVSQHHDRAILNICLAYTSRQEIQSACAEVLEGVRAGKLSRLDLCEDIIDQSLYTSPYSQVDLLIRTSGETRMSDFMLWQASLACLSFQHVLWPDFSLTHLAWSVLTYQRSRAALCLARERHRAALWRLSSGGSDGASRQRQQQFVDELRQDRIRNLHRIFPDMAPGHGDQGKSDAAAPGGVLGGVMRCLAGEAVGQDAGHASQRWDGDCAGRWMVVGALLASAELAAWATLLTAGVLIVSRVHVGRE